MTYNIADLITEIPEVGGLAANFGEYIYDGDEPVDITIDKALYNESIYPFKLTGDDLIYMESGRQFFARLLNFNGMYLHSSSVELDGRAYMFSAYSGTGKSTHTMLWQQIFGERARIFNDDKTPMRCINGIWYAYGAPWSGKNYININIKAPVAGICFLKQAEENRIRRLSPKEAVEKIIAQTIMKFRSAERLDLMLPTVDKIVREIPIFELENKPEPEAAWLSYETMSKTAEEMKL